MPRMFRISYDIEVPDEWEMDCLDVRDDIAVFIQEQDYPLANGTIMEMERKKILACEYFRIE